MGNIEQIFNDLKEDAFAFSKEELGEFYDQGKLEIELFLENSKKELKELASDLILGKLGLEEFKDLSLDQKDLLLLKTIKIAGIGQLKLDKLKDGLIEIVISKIVEHAPS